jgi:predicted methyltransferase
MRITYLAPAVAIIGCAIGACSQSEQPAMPAAEQAAHTQPVASLATRLADGSRSDEDRARDAGRKPAEVLEFLGIEPGMRVIDVIAAAGWYTEVLAVAVGEAGHVVAQNPGFVLQFRDGANEKAISERLADNRLPNVSRLNMEFEDMGAADGPFDAAITALNFHDMYNGRGPEVAVAFLRTVGDVLKPGGVFGVIDHAGAAGADNASLHRIEVALVIESAEAAGFIVEGESRILANPDDDGTQGVFAEGLRGNTDRFIVKLRKR